MKTSLEEIRSIIEGKPLAIPLPCPLDGMQDRPWFVRQPDDWVYDAAQAVYDAKKALTLALPDVAEVRSLPPSDGWVQRQERARIDAQRRLGELDEQKRVTPLTMEDDLERRNLISYLALLLSPKEFTRADEIANRVARDQRDWYLMQKLIVDDRDQLLFDLRTEDGRRRWHVLGRSFREQLSPYITTVLSWVQTAKNSEASQHLR